MLGHHQYDISHAYYHHLIRVLTSKSQVVIGIYELKRNPNKEETKRAIAI